MNSNSNSNSLKACIKTLQTFLANIPFPHSFRVISPKVSSGSRVQGPGSRVEKTNLWDKHYWQNMLMMQPPVLSKVKKTHSRSFEIFVSYLRSIGQYLRSCHWFFHENLALPLLNSVMCNVWKTCPSNISVTFHRCTHVMEQVPHVTEKVSQVTHILSSVTPVPSHVRTCDIGSLNMWRYHQTCCRHHQTCTCGKCGEIESFASSESALFTLSDKQDQI